MISKIRIWLLSILKSSRLGITYRVLYYDNCNWDEFDWKKVFSMSKWMKLLYHVQYVKISAFLNASTFEIKDLEEVNRFNYKTIAYQGYNLWELSKTGILAALEEVVLPVELSASQISTIKHYYIQVCHLLNGGKTLLEDKKPAIILLTQGATPMARPILELARDMGINCVAKEGAFLRDYIFLDNLTGMIINRHTASRQAGDWLYSRAFGSDDRRRLRVKMKQAQYRKRPEHETGSTDDLESDIRSMLKIKQDEKIAVFIGQVFTDASIIMDSPYFPDPVLLINKLSEWFTQKEGWRLVIRLHPKESDGYSWISISPDTLGLPAFLNSIEQLPYNNITIRKLKEINFQEVYKNVPVLEGRSIDTQALMEIADLGITINSQAGFEMALKGKRMVVCGDAFYARKGFTYDVSHPAALESILEAACQNTNLSDGELAKTEQFGAYLFDSVLLPRELNGDDLKRMIRIIDGNKNSSFTRKLISEKAASAFKNAN